MSLGAFQINFPKFKERMVAYEGPSDSEAKPETWYFIYDFWDDYAYRTSFHVYYSDIENKVHKIGIIKFLILDSNGENLKSFEKENIEKILKNAEGEYCSLWEKLACYRTLQDLFPEQYESILDTLHDSAYFPKYREKYEELKCFKTSLRRLSSSDKALSEARSLLTMRGSEDKDMSFDYRIISSDGDSTDLQFRFIKNDYLPYRINALVGKNGVGKSTILSHIAHSLCGYPDYVKKGDSLAASGAFVDDANKPPFDQVIYISYNPYDYYDDASDNRPHRGVIDIETNNFVFCSILKKNEEDKLYIADQSEFWCDCKKSFEKMKNVAGKVIGYPLLMNSLLLSRMILNLLLTFQKNLI
ncbi:ABC transporter ATP-binding protein [Bifidobacterium samirii]|uniref:Uncharacterized protein n=1 Tax=Bifidobacterium samirii TaxID=2306974 RepID=A0A430FEY7_9BIFI|nr:ABC transporter ATP-binding protein [Bifidobacterium samirii]RSX51423.1 hypothetical protein D2E24_1889 [Bifidobacterium samirii]